MVNALEQIYFQFTMGRKEFLQLFFKLFGISLFMRLIQLFSWVMTLSLALNFNFKRNASRTMPVA